MAIRQERNTSLKFSMSKALVALMASMLILGLVLRGASAQPASGLEAKSQFNGNGNNNLDSIISELIDDASHRLKKSKNGRHLKSSLRFGRRSDPLFAPSELEEQQDNNFNQVPFYLD